MLRFHADFKGNDHACERKVSEFHGGWVKRKREREEEEREEEERERKRGERKKVSKEKKKKGRNRAEKKMEEERCGGRGLGAIACSSTVSLKE